MAQSRDEGFVPGIILGMSVIIVFIVLMFATKTWSQTETAVFQGRCAQAGGHVNGDLCVKGSTIILRKGK